MPVTFQKEFVFEVRQEVDDLLQLHYTELTLNKDRVKLKPMWEQYGALEVMGRFVVFTARADRQLVGYSAFFLNRHLHYADLMVAMNDVLFLHPDHRCGSTGLRLIKFSEDEIKALGADKICWHAKLDTALIPILKRMKYSVEEMSLAKLL